MSELAAAGRSEKSDNGGAPVANPQYAKNFFAAGRYSSPPRDNDATAHPAIALAIIADASGAPQALESATSALALIDVAEIDPLDPARARVDQRQGYRRSESI